MHLKMSSGKLRPSCLGLNVLNSHACVIHTSYEKLATVVALLCAYEDISSVAPVKTENHDNDLHTFDAVDTGFNFDWSSALLERIRNLINEHMVWYPVKNQSTKMGLNNINGVVLLDRMKPQHLNLPKKYRRATLSIVI